MNPVINIQQLNFRYGGRTVLKDINLTIEPGSFYALLGQNGAGKSTLLKLTAGLLAAKVGKVETLGRDARYLKAEDWTQIGFVSEAQPLYDWLTGQELINFVRPFYPNWDTVFCDKLLSRLRLPLERKVKSFSKGERMKMMLLLAMAFHPRLLLLDEPFSGLDVLAKEQLIACLLEATEQEQWAVVFASHDLSEVERLADYIGIIEKGELRINESLESLQGRFRKVQAFNQEIPPDQEPSMYQLSRMENGFSFVESQYSEERKAEFQERFGEDVEMTPLALREIVLAQFTADWVPHE